MKAAAQHNQCQCSQGAGTDFAVALEKMATTAAHTDIGQSLEAGGAQYWSAGFQPAFPARPRWSFGRSRQDGGAPFICLLQLAEQALNTAAGLASGLLSRVCLGLIWVYQMTRYLRQPSCRFYPSCSQYAVDSIKRFGPLRGLILGLMRLLRCNPFGPYGYDPVPAEFSGAFPAKITELGRVLRQAASPAVLAGAIPIGAPDQRRGKR